MKNYNLKNSQLFIVTSVTDYKAPQDGWLTFIINEAINSQYSPSTKSNAYYEALKRAEQKLSGDSRHQIGSIPLIWFADNLGTFRVTVKFLE